MKIEGSKIIMESMVDALNVWARPQDADYIGGGAKSIEYAAWDYAGTDTSITKSNFHLAGANNNIQRFYDKLCANSYDYSKEVCEFNFETGEHNFPEECDIARILTTYHKNPAGFKLKWIETADDLQMVIINLDNKKKFEISAAGDIYDHIAYWTFYHIFQEQHRIADKETARIKVDEFLS